MPIGFDNETGRCIRSAELEEGHWYVTADNQLFIVPRDGEIEGPDGDLSDQLEAAYRRIGFENVCEQTLAAELGLGEVPHYARQFDPLLGYFASASTTHPDRVAKAAGAALEQAFPWGYRSSDTEP